MIGPLFEKGKIGVLREAPTNKKKNLIWSGQKRKFK